MECCLNIFDWSGFIKCFFEERLVLARSVKELYLLLLYSAGKSIVPSLRLINTLSWGLIVIAKAEKSLSSLRATVLPKATLPLNFCCLMF